MNTDQVKQKAEDLKQKADKFNPEKREGPVAKAIEEYTARVPSDVYLWAAVGCMAVSATLQMMGRKHSSLFVGQWPAPFLLMGLYNKLVKVEGSDRSDKGGFSGNRY